MKSYSKKILTGLAALTVVLMGSSMAFAEAAATGGSEAAAAASGSGASPITLAALFIAAALCVSFGAFSPALAQGKAVKAACDGIARNPGIAGKLTSTMIVGLALIEALAIYSFVIALILLFVIFGQIN